MSHNDEKFDVRLQFVYKTKPKVTTTHHHNHPKTTAKTVIILIVVTTPEMDPKTIMETVSVPGMPTPVSVVTTTHLPMDLLNYLIHPQQQRLQI